ncbi:hypothetical protein NEF87_004171 [Candidatus Lokiarchaeum ossiferum]|uniref:Uncharacterized protein n=1 Tax=Candidatus Lokiarchaeum ossiferum TaxID=2951803 RepID=A0ABY6HWY4_9ARCH|nr:hypothetical protein NEF87_004171 [Candidatus Lokiarchaeum sp. B-35]
MSSKDAIRKNIEQLRNFQKKLLKNLSKIEQDTREEMIRNSYSMSINQIAPWLNFNQISEISPEGKSLSQNDINYVIKVAKTLKQIKIAPEQKEIILNQFLKELEAISDSDRVVLLENFKELPIEFLQEELTNICQIFCNEK